MAAICGGSWWTSDVRASDHDEAPLVKADGAQDITDVYVFESGPNKTTIIVCWAGFNDSLDKPTKSGVYDGNALYTIHVDNDGDNESDLKLYWRFGTNAKDEIGIQWSGIPGADPAVAGPVETVFDAGTFARVWAGHADDPFFFDAQGYLEGLDTQTVSFMSNRDFLAGLNVTAAAIEIDTDVLTGGNPIQVWATSARKG
ncbi:DUF4331 family protein [Nannocystis bainbridge]|uniref:DUF4331 family protein n=1 Tax=Nannocystis bainbridge TaxID=2995303 RepID=A0ABT5E549_9BACT|nr:DUF4331 family protein [Nannocystis bainbridge]MDC0720979.1 DUF4331 family protein [Nannocystis bainbridge]